MEKRQIIFEKKTNIINPINKHRNPFDSHTEGITRMDFRIDPDITKKDIDDAFGRISNEIIETAISVQKNYWKCF